MTCIVQCMVYNETAYDVARLIEDEWPNHKPNVIGIDENDMQPYFANEFQDLYCDDYGFRLTEGAERQTKLAQKDWAK